MSLSLLQRSAASLTEADLARLLADGVPESLTLDYKLDLSLDQRSDRKEFAADISALANKSGGYILYGISEAGGVPTVIDGLEVSDLDALKLRITNVLGSLVTPKIAGLEVEGIHVSSGKVVLAIRVPGSLAAPHSADGRFYGRSIAGKYEMDIAELAFAFRSSAGFEERAKAFHRHRRDMVQANSWAVRLVPRPRFILHAIPRTAFSVRHLCDR
jgi:predicted HTH transcriptional regulator